MSVVIDLNVVCLVCLRKANEYHSIYDNDEQGPNISIVEKITQCSDLNIPNDSTKLPDKVCKGCYDDLQATWRFRQNCKEANSVFQYIQQQEDEPEVLATLELESQRIKLPLGLKIKKMHANSPKSQFTSVNIKNEHFTAEYDALDLEYEYITEDRLSKNSQNNLNLGDESAGNTDEDRDADVGENKSTSELKSEEEEEILGDNPTDAERKESVKSAIIENSKCRQISTNAAARVRGRPKKSAGTMVPPQTSNLKQTSKFSANKTSSKSGTRVRRRTESVSEARLPKICDICGNSYKYQHALKAHMRRHNNDRPFSCEFCDKSFVACVELQRHMRVHTGQKPYSCKFCDRRFSDFGSRLKHERTHTGERPYRCTTCGKCFAYAHVLSVHLRTHTGEKRFPCDRCERGFTKKAYLLAHQEQHCGKNDFGSKEDDDNKSMMTIDEAIYTEDDEFIVEELHEIDMIAKEELNVEEEVVQDDLNEFTTVEADAEQMAEEHLDEVDENEIVFEMR